MPFVSNVNLLAFAVSCWTRGNINVNLYKCSKNSLKESLPCEHMGKNSGNCEWKLLLRLKHLNASMNTMLFVSISTTVQASAATHSLALLRLTKPFLAR